MKLIETAINEQGESYIHTISEPKGWTIPGHTITDIFFTKTSPLSMMAECDELSDKNFNLKPGEIRFFRTDIGPTQTMYDELKKTDPNLPPFKRTYYHSTTTVDYIIVLKGPVVIIVGDEEVELQTGDCVVQRGAAHTWHNYSSEVVTIMGILIGVTPPPQFKSIG
jgi:mannose-6-phosphate isomerase-like protein (cupin superfamily)